MNKYLLLLLLLCYSLASRAQDTTQTSSTLSFHIGSATALGSFNDNAFEKDYPPFAKVGTLLKLSYSKNIKSNLGVGATAAYRWNPFKEEEFAEPGDDLVQQLDSKPWQSGFILADVQYQVPFGTAELLYVRGSVGGSFNRSAGLQVQTPFGTIARQPDNSFALAYGIGTGLSTERGRFIISVEASLLGTKPRFEVTDQQGRTDSYKQPMATYNLGLALGYRLGQ